MKIFTVTSYIIIGLTLSLVACQPTKAEPIFFPDRDLVFQRYDFNSNNAEDHAIDQLGFVNTDGSSLEIVDTDKIIEKPVWSADGMFLYGLSSSPGGYPAYWNKATGLFGICNHDMPYYFQIEGSDNQSNPYEVVIQDTWTIIMMDLSNCTEVRRLVDYEADPGKYDIGGFSYSSDQQELVYGLVIGPYKNRRFQIMRLDINSGKQVQVGVGINPTWSPDGNLIAYLGLDGLYVSRSDGSEIRKIVDYLFFDQWASGSLFLMTPIPRWSPDGKWLVYYVCTDKLCSMDKSEIYKVSVDGGQPEKILTGGQNPSWNP